MVGVQVFNVSIPFKRESVSKGLETDRFSWGMGAGFNSLQTGKRIQSLVKEKEK